MHFEYKITEMKSLEHSYRFSKLGPGPTRPSPPSASLTTNRCPSIFPYHFPLTFVRTERTGKQSSSDPFSSDESLSSYSRIVDDEHRVEKFAAVTSSISRICSNGLSLIISSYLTGSESIREKRRLCLSYRTIDIGLNLSREMRREERRRKFHDGLVNMLYPKAPPASQVLSSLSLLLFYILTTLFWIT